MTTIVKIIGALAIIAAASGLWMTFFTELSGPGGKTALASMYTFQLIISSFLIYGAHLKKVGSDLAQKVYPSSIAAMALYTAFAYRWFSHGI
ncbi:MULTISPECIES: hypothetical protein [unclassified Endozoicomonas]|uniref:hypothetical protein n=1 Tax=unclassified Endozoicomonas TaxID=2644528 RepID=UPI003BAF0F4B